MSRVSSCPRAPRGQGWAYLHDPSVESGGSQDPRPVHRPAVILGAPAGAVDVDVLRLQAQGLSLHDVHDGAVQHPHA